METTDLDPAAGGRVCEVAVVRMRGDGTVLDEYATLVNPGIRIENDFYHGISDVHVVGTPTFAQIAGDLMAYLSGAITVAHKLEYEDRHLGAEFARLGIRPYGVPGLCSLILARTQLDRYAYKLSDVALLVRDEWPPAQHTALGDARALAQVLATLIADAPHRLSWAGPPPRPLPEIPRTGIIAPRAGQLRRGSEGWLATLTARLPLMTAPPLPRPDRLADYQALLSRALADGKVVAEEADQLALLAARAGLTQSTARHVHEEFLTKVRNRAEADGVVTSAELRELRRAAKNLAAGHLIDDLERAAAADRDRRSGPLKGWRILPVGEDTGEAGAQLTEVIDWATAHGATVAANLTKTVRLVIVAGDSADPRLDTARESGMPVVDAADARRLLEAEIEVNSGASGLFDKAGGDAVAAELTAERERLAGPPGWHTFWRRHELSPAQYHQLFVAPYEDEDDGSRTAAGPQRHTTYRATVPVRPQPAGSQGGGCAGAAVLLVGLATATTAVLAGLRRR